jgi:putative intracellular protease/amidase
VKPAATEERETEIEQDGEHIFALVAKLARRASDGQLVAAAATGIAAAAFIGLLAPGWWLAALPLLCIGSFGVWGIAERTAAERLETLGPGYVGRRALTVVRIAAATIGTLAGSLVLLTLAAIAVGTWRS